MPSCCLFRISRRLLTPTSLSAAIAAHRNFHPDLSSPSPSPSPSPSDPVSHLASFFSAPPPLRTRPDLPAAALSPEIAELVLRRVRGWRAACEFFRWAKEQPGFAHTCYTYTCLAEILARAKKLPPLRALADDMVTSRIPTSPGALGFLIRCYGAAGLFEEACFLLDHAMLLNCVPTVYTYNCLLEALRRSGRIDLVEARYREMVDLGWLPDKFTLTALLQAFCDGGRIADALNVFDRIREKNWVDKHVFAILVVSLSKCGEVEKALELVDKVEDYNVKLNEKTVCVLIHGFKREKRVKEALILFGRMDKLGFRKDLALYSVMIDGLCESGEFDKALNLYDEMRRSDVFPGAGVIAQLLRCFLEKGDVDTVKRLTHENEKTLNGNGAVLVYNAILNGLVSKGDVDQAYLLLQAMIKTGRSGSHESEAVESDQTYWNSLTTGSMMHERCVRPNSASFSIVINALCQRENLEIALELVNYMIEIDCADSVLVFNNLIHKLCDHNRLENSHEILRKMESNGIKPTAFTYNSILGCLCRRENVPEALKLIKEMRCNGFEPWIKHYTFLVKQLCVHNKVLEACNFLVDLTKSGFWPSVIAYSAAIDGLCRINKLEEALSLFKDLSAHKRLPDLVAHNIIIRGFCKAGKVLEAQDMVNEMLSKGLVPSVITYNLLINGWCKIDNIDEALLCFSRMVKERCPPTVVTYTTLIDGLCHSKRPHEAVSMWIKMSDNGCVPNRIAYMAVISGLCKCGQPDDALCYLKRMNDAGLVSDSFVYVELMNAFLLKDNPIMSLEILRVMVKKTRFPGPSLKIYDVWICILLKLYDDERTAFNIKQLIEDGCLPFIQCLDDLKKGQ